ncbi:RNA-directed DNA polymerase [Arachis hypogaea]|nr:RNA-directed DNA polymerase [Arachis hypogaea]
MNLLKDGYGWCTRGLYQSFWHVLWSSFGPLHKDLPYIHITDFHLTESWHLERLATPIFEKMKAMIICFNPSMQVGAEPRWRWLPTASHIYSSRDGYMWLLKKNFPWDESLDRRWIWKLSIPEKIKFLM